MMWLFDYFNYLRFAIFSFHSSSGSGPGSVPLLFDIRVIWNDRILYFPLTPNIYCTYCTLFCIFICTCVFEFLRSNVNFKVSSTITCSEILYMVWRLIVKDHRWKVLKFRMWSCWCSFIDNNSYQFQSIELLKSKLGCRDSSEFERFSSFSF